MIYEYVRVHTSDIAEFHVESGGHRKMTRTTITEPPATRALIIEAAMATDDTPNPTTAAAMSAERTATRMPG